MLVEREGLWQRTQEEYATLGAPPQYWHPAWRKCCFCLRGSLWQKQELYGELITTAQEAWSHAHNRATFLSLLSGDFSNNSGSIYSILLILKTNPSVLVTIHCQKKDRAGQDLHVTGSHLSPFLFYDSKRWSDAENSPRIQARVCGGGGALLTKVV